MNEGEELSHIQVPKCFECELAYCIHFFKKVDKLECIELIEKPSELEGMEFYILWETINKGAILPCIIVFPIQTLCRCNLVLSQDEELKNLPVIIVLWQCIKDLKCSAFLALCGHYRNAMQVLRPVLENFLVGLYFMYQKDYSDFIEWTKGKYKIPPSLYYEITGTKPLRKDMSLNWQFCLEFLIKKAIYPEYQNLWTKRKNYIAQKIINPLNKYLHAYFPFFDIEHISCPASVKFDKKALNEWLEVLQRILYLILEYLIEVFGEKLLQNKYSRDALELLVYPKEKRIRNEFLRYKEYREFIKKLEKILNKEEK